jgi:hypothetical protein
MTKSRVALTLAVSLACASCNGQPKSAATPASQRNVSAQGSIQDDILIGSASTEAPGLTSLVDDQRGIKHAPNGFYASEQYFEFNPSTKEVGLAKELPGGISMQEIYGNRLFDGAGLKLNKRLLFGTVLVPTDRRAFNDDYGCAELGVSFEEHSRVLISSNYVVSAAEAGLAPQAKPSSYSVVAVFDPSDGERFITGTLNVSRNGAKPTRLPLSFPAGTTPVNVDNIPIAKTGFPVVELANVHRRTDTIQWSVERDGKIRHKGVFAFPVVGTVPRVVCYWVRISKHETK